ncbi:hypothetical protein NKH77_10005 [Streptomyces sp. M19]
MVGTARGRLSLRSAWRTRRADAAGSPARPGAGPDAGHGAGAEPAGGGVVRFARSSCGCGWPPGRGVLRLGRGRAGAVVRARRACPEADERATLEPDTDGGWRVVSERVTVAVSRIGAVEVRTPGGVVLRRDLPPRWWAPVGAEDPYAPGERDGERDDERIGERDDERGGERIGERTAKETRREVEMGGYGARRGRGSGRAEHGGGPGGWCGRWVQRSEVPADARFFGLGARAAGPRLRDGTYRLWNTDPGSAAGGSRRASRRATTRCT